MADKKELKEEYKNRRPPMGVLELYCRETGERFLEASVDIPADTNSITFKLRQGYHPNRKLLASWKKYGAEGFEIRTAKELKYKEEPADYKAEVELLREICLEEDAQAMKVWK